MAFIGWKKRQILRSKIADPGRAKSFKYSCWVLLTQQFLPFAKLRAARGATYDGRLRPSGCCLLRRTWTSIVRALEQALWNARRSSLSFASAVLALATGLNQNSIRPWLAPKRLITANATRRADRKRILPVPYSIWNANYQRYQLPVQTTKIPSSKLVTACANTQSQMLLVLRYSQVTMPNHAAAASGSPT